MGDVNWLLSSIAQGSAAMIAIVGGLLVSRYVGLHAEQEAARRRVTDLHARQASADARKTEFVAALEGMNVDELINQWDVYDAIVAANLELPLDQLFALTGKSRADFDGNRVRQGLDAIVNEMGQAIPRLHKLVPTTKTHPSWSQFYSAHHDLPVGNVDVWEWAYDHTCDDARKQARAAMSAQDRLMSGIAAAGFNPQDFPTFTPRSDLPSRRRQLTDRIEAADADSRAAREEAKLAREALDASRQPAGFSLAIQVLTVLAILGIALPVIVMGFEVTTLPEWLRAGVIVVFFAGVGLLLRYLFVYASFLREGGRETLPATAWGLLGRERRAGASAKKGTRKNQHSKSAEKPSVDV